MPSNLLYQMQEFMKFKQQFQGGPQQQQEAINQILQRGDITRAQYEEAIKNAQILQQFMGSR